MKDFPVPRALTSRPKPVEQVLAVEATPWHYTDLKSPIFNGEEKDRNKDIIHTFPKKFQMINSLMKIPPH